MHYSFQTHMNSFYPERDINLLASPLPNVLMLLRVLHAGINRVTLAERHDRRFVPNDG
ncbi:MAG: hypothetical protein ABGZ23_23915 [Fuerstiella sp.]